MTVYAKKNAAGLPNGLYMVEVVVSGKRIRETVKGLEAAREREVVLKLGQGARMPPPSPSMRQPRAYTVGDLKRDALVCWAGTKDESQSIQRFELACDILGTKSHLVDIRTGQLDKLVAELKARSLSPQTIHRYLAAFSKGLRWAHARDYIMGMPVFPWPEPGKPRETTISHADEEKIFKYLAKTGSPDVALVVETLLVTGARISEVLGVETQDIKPAKGTVTFRDTKNGSDRTVPLPEPLAARLQALATVGMPTYRRINTALHRARRALKIEYVVTPHVYRHTAGTRMSDGGVSLPTIGKLLGHKNVKTTMGYVHPEMETMREAASLIRRKS